MRGLVLVMALFLASGAARAEGDAPAKPDGPAQVNTSIRPVGASIKIVDTQSNKVDTQNNTVGTQINKVGTPTDSDSFDLLPPEAAPDPEAVSRQAELERKLGRRRTMLQLHQVGGFVTLAGLAATVVVGQLNYADKYGGGGDTGKYLAAHETLAVGTSVVFAATGLLALLAPSPLDKPLRLDTSTAHKVAMGVATAGMITEIVLGIVTAGSESSAQSPDFGLHQRNLAVAHQVIGYTTLVATAAGFTVLMF